MNNENSDNDFKPLVELAKTSYSHIEPLVKSLNSVFKDEPNLKRALMLLKAPSSISDAIFMHKFNAFYEAGKLNEANIKKLNKKLTGRKKARLWKLIFSSIQSHDDEKRSTLVGKVIVALTAEKITCEEAVRMIHASNRVNVDNLDYLLNCYLGNPGSMPGYARQEFVIVGLLGIDQSRLGTWDSGSGGITYPLVDFGAKYVGAIYNYPPYPNAKNIRVGEDRLVNAGKDTSNSFRKEVPLKYAKDKGYWYGEAALILRDKNKVLLVNKSPLIVSSPIFAGEYGEKAISNVTNIKEDQLKSICSFNDLSRHVTIWVYSLDNNLASPTLRPNNGSWIEYKQLAKDKSGFLHTLSDALLKYDTVQLTDKLHGPYDF